MAPTERRTKLIAVTIATLVALWAFSAWAINAQRSIEDPSRDGLDILQGLPDPDGSVFQDHMAWVIEVLNGADYTDDDLQQRFSVTFLDSIGVEGFRSVTTDVSAEGPHEFLGLVVDEEAGLAQIALETREGQPLAASVALEQFEPTLMGGLFIVPAEPTDGPFSNAEFAIVFGAGVLLVISALALAWFGRPALGVLVGLAAALWLAQLFELTEVDLLFTVGLCAGPFAIGLLGSAAVCEPNGRLGSRFGGLVVAALSGATVMALMPLTAIDTSQVALPKNRVLNSHDKARALDWLRLSGWAVAAAAGLLVLFVLLRQFRTDWQSGRGLVSTTLATVAGAALVIVSASSAAAGVETYDLSQPPTLSFAAILLAVGLVGSAYWDNYDLGDVAEELQAENQLLQAEVELQLAEVQASRARIVEAGDVARKKIERDLHDGAQQRLLAILLGLRMKAHGLGDDSPEVREFLTETADELGVAVSELRELSRGLHPAILSDGVVAAAESLAESAAVPTKVITSDVSRCPSSVEQAAYFVISEALANATRHADAKEIVIEITTYEDQLTVSVADDGSGGAEPSEGSGLQNIEDRVLAIGGTWNLESDSRGTTVRASFPCG